MDCFLPPWIRKGCHTKSSAVTMSPSKPCYNSHGVLSPPVVPLVGDGQPLAGIDTHRASPSPCCWGAQALDVEIP